MDWKKYRVFILFTIISLNPGNYGKACSWLEYPETIRLAAFKVEIPGMSVFRPFYYSAELFNSYIPDPENFDELRNCAEWQATLGTDVNLEDIRVILYQTSPEQFENLHQRTELSQFFKENTFVSKILSKGFEAYFDYLVFAKEMEYENLSQFQNWENWENDESVVLNKDYQYIAKDVISVKNPFLQKRYAFLLSRWYYHHGKYQDVIKLYKKYFNYVTDKGLIDAWALFFYAMANDEAGEKVFANYLYSVAFAKSDSKKFRIMQCFNHEPEMIQKTLSLAANNVEKSDIISLWALNYPGRSLEQLEKIVALNPRNQFLAPLIMREVNKIEDWIFTPRYTQYLPSTSKNFYDNTDNFRFQNKNMQSDSIYLKRVVSFLKNLVASTKGDLHDMIALAVAHLSFIADDTLSGKKYLGMISSDAKPAVLQQKNTDELLVLLKSSDIESTPVQNVLADKIGVLESLQKKLPEINKTLYSVLRIISGEYERKNDYAIAGLLFLKSEKFKDEYEYYKLEYDGHYEPSYYWKIGYFDRRATIKDMDHLILLIRKKTKNKFEQYLCSQKLADINAYLDLKGTMALRENNFRLANECFSKIPDDFYINNYEFGYYLHENPFLPKILNKNISSSPRQYVFSKAKFTEGVLSLFGRLKDNPKRADSIYLTLGHVYFNCSYWGNSWMMINYGKGVYEGEQNPNSFLFGSVYRRNMQMMSGNYYLCKMAENFYRKAYEHGKSAEVRAAALLMLHQCDYSAWKFIHFNYTWDMPWDIKYKPGPYLKELYRNYTSTDLFKNFTCSMLDDFLSYKKQE